MRAGSSPAAGGCRAGAAAQGLLRGCTQPLFSASAWPLQLMNVTAGEAGGKWSRNAGLPSQISSASLQTGSHRATAQHPRELRPKGDLARVAHLRDTCQPQSCAHIHCHAQSIPFPVTSGAENQNDSDLCVHPVLRHSPSSHLPSLWHPLGPAGAVSHHSGAAPRALPALSTAQRAANCQSQGR